MNKLDNSLESPNTKKLKPKRIREDSPEPYKSIAGQSIPDFVNEFWQHTTTTAEESSTNFKHQSLPLARIKKVMKSDPDVKMISSEVTIILEKACQIFIQEVTARSHLISLSSNRRTLSKPDVIAALTKSDMFDFLIDIIPRGAMDGEEFTATGRKKKVKTGTGGSGTGGAKGKGKKKKEEEIEEEEDELE